MSRSGRALAGGAQFLLFVVVAVGVLARIAAIPSYVPDSGDEWGNTVAPFRILFEGGDPNTFLHPSLCYDVTAAVYAAVFGAAKLVGAVDRSLSMAELFVVDQRFFVFTARAVSVVSAALTMAALYAMGSWLWNRWAGWCAAALVAVLPLHAIYSEAVRVDSFFLAVFVYAFLGIARVAKQPDRATYARAGVWTGLAASANYNGAILLPWLCVAHVLAVPGRSTRKPEAVWFAASLGLAALAFMATSPFIFFNFETFRTNFAFISGLSAVEHPGMEGRGVLFYVEDLAQTYPLLVALLGVSIAAILAVGDRIERFALSLPLAYFALFSLMRTKFDRFVLPALVLFLLMAGGTPFVLIRRLGRGVVGVVAAALVCALMVACAITLARGAMPVPRHPMLEPPEAVLFEWIERNVPRRSAVLVESGLAPLVDTMKEPGRFAAELRKAVVTARPNLDLQFIGAVFVGGANYDAATLQRIDFAIVSRRNLRYVDGRCEAMPDVCSFYRGMRDSGRLVFETPEGVEPALIYDVRRR